MADMKSQTDFELHKEELLNSLGGLGKVVGYIFWGLLATAAIATSFYTVPADSEAVVQRFGKYQSTQGPGLHLRLPFWADKATVVPVRRQLKLEFGFSTEGATNPKQSDPDAEHTRAMVTGDLNEAEVQWAIQYRITDPKQYLFGVQDPEDTLRAASEAVMREVIGDRTIDEVITFGRQGIETEALTRLKPLVTQYDLGISIDLVQLKNIDPPKMVQASFNDVNNAQQEKQKAINQASGEYNKEIPKARGEAARLISVAQGYAAKRINEAAGDADYFNAQLTQYLKAPEVTQKRLYLETMGEILPRMGQKFIIDSDVSRLVPLLPLQGLPKPTTAAVAAQAAAAN